MICRNGWLGLLLFSLLLLAAQPAHAQAEGLELKHSPNGKRALQLHAEKRQGLEATYLESIGDPLTRFEQTCERHIKRYTSMLDREIRTLTRQGSLEQAKAVQAAMEQAEEWTITAPNNKGLHFLSKTNLQVEGSEKATKFGVDLQVGVESAGVLYNKQVDRLFTQYQSKVQAARESLQGELAKVKDIEQRAGRLDAVQELQAALAAMKKLPAIEKPQPKASEPEDGARDRPGREIKPFDKFKVSEAFLGFYSIRYNGPDRLYREVLVELREDRALVRGEYSYTREREIKWTQEDSGVEVGKRNDTGMSWRFEESSGAEVVINLQLTERYSRVYIDSGTTFSMSTDKSGFTEPARCYVRKLGYKPETVKGFEDGVYNIALDLKRDPEGNEIKGEMKFRLEVTSGTFFINQRTSVDKPDKFKDCMPTVFRVRAQGGNIIWEAEYSLGRQQEMFVQRVLKDGTKEMQLWWDRSDYRNGQTADAFGTLTKAKD